MHTTSLLRRAAVNLVPQTERLAGVKPVPLAAVCPFTPAAIKTTTLSNGIKIVSEDDGSQVAHITIAVHAGGVNETPTTVGITHYIRNMAFQTTANQSALHLTREAELHGAQLSSWSTREYIAYTAQFLRSDLEAIGTTVAETVAVPSIFDWEVRRQDERVTADVHVMAEDASQVLLDDVHRVAFRGTALSRPLIIPSSRIGHFTAADIIAFRAQHFTPANITVVGYGLDHQALVGLMDKKLQAIKKSTGATPAAPKSVYAGGESLTYADTHNTAAILAFRGVAQNSTAEVAAAAVLRQILGGDGSALKWGSDSSASRVGAAAKSATAGMFTVSGFSLSYHETGVLGSYITTSNSDIVPVIKAAAKTIKSVLSGDVSDEEVKAAKSKAVLHVLSTPRTQRAWYQINGASVEQFADAIKSIDTAAVKRVAQQANGAPATFAIRGNLDNVPTIKDLGF